MLHVVSFVGGFNTAKEDIMHGRIDLESSSASSERVFQALLVSTLRNGIAVVTNKQPSWYFVTESSYLD